MYFFLLSAIVLDLLVQYNTQKKHSSLWHQQLQIFSVQTQTLSTHLTSLHKLSTTDQQLRGLHYCRGCEPPQHHHNSLHPTCTSHRWLCPSPDGNQLLVTAPLSTKLQPLVFPTCMPASRSSIRIRKLENNRSHSTPIHETTLATKRVYPPQHQNDNNSKPPQIAHYANCTCNFTNICNFLIANTLQISTHNLQHNYSLGTYLLVVFLILLL